MCWWLEMVSILEVFLDLVAVLGVGPLLKSRRVVVEIEVTGPLRATQGFPYAFLSKTRLTSTDVLS